ncbi:C-type lectin domain family 12 member A-like isoform X1 [Falco biarmicus]|uniref:C-type lectin domain family 12 member A isoform X1 n=1 Tax=Falco peregrinus TaxID=8954 RepID=UPI000678C452|nr:C-type lectin domain family 12 member A isoform X1 [Falco peregrinus]XP_037245155.1 C-type lectin domain family 12 member A-like isoform X1 [Falco rusticolus]XP_056196531.1 C-type lectin domain family 12 member A-like isoform X1 [Falco biarmicus]
MTEEIVYANLKFENNHELDNITEPEETKEKASQLHFTTELLPGPPTSSRSYWPVVLILFMLCLALLMALVTLAVLFIQIPKDYRTQLTDLNMTKNQLHANFSNILQAIGNQLCLEGEKNLKNNGQNCVLCPANWLWKGGDTCYYHSKEEKSWEQSHQFCSSRNSTLLLIKDAAKMKLVQEFPRETYWLGLTFRDEQREWYWTDNTVLTKQMPWVKHLHPQYCGYIYYDSIYSTPCTRKYYYVCEKPAILFQRGSNHWQDWFVRPK